MYKKESRGEKLEQFSLKRREATVLLLSMFMMSFAVLSFEISLTRMFSVMFAYHYVFLTVSIAFAGLGLGGLLAQLMFTVPNNKKDLFASLAAIYSVFALMISFFTLITTTSPSPNFVATSFMFFLSFLPAGLFLATTYKFFATYSNILYGADIVGASLGAFGTVTFLNSFNPVITVLLVCTVLSIISLLFVLVRPRKKSVLSMTLLAFLLTASMLSFSFYFSKDVPTGNDQGKELYEFLKDPTLGARIVESRWSAFGRTDLVELQTDPHSKVIFIDGGAGTNMYHFNGNFSDSSNEVYGLRFSTAAFPFYSANNESALIIGPGGGKDVLIALMFNFSHIHAVEINPETVDIVKEYSHYNGGIYTNYTSAHVHVDEGRSFLKRNPTKYDVIMLNIPITKTIQGTTGYSMAENYLFTTDSLKDFLNHLNDDGRLIIVAHERVEIYKLVTTALSTMSEGNIQEAMRQMVVVESMQHPSFPVLILKKTAFTHHEVDGMIEKSSELNLQRVYFPYANVTSKSNLDRVLVALEDGEVDLNTLIDQASRSQVDLGPPSDDKPFFYKFESGLPFTLPSLVIGFSVLAVIATIGYLLNWGRRLNLVFKKERHLLAEKFSIFMPYYFASLGLGFMLIEVALIQRFILFLGPPTLAITTVLFSLLFSMGAGGFISKKWKEPTGFALKSFLLIGVLIIVYIFLLPFVFDALLGVDLGFRLLTSFALTFPAGFLLGIPFPTGIRIMTQRSNSDDVAWMWGINGLYSLVGSTLAVVIAMSFGFSVVLLSGAASYLMVFLLGRLYFKS